MLTDPLGEVKNKSQIYQQTSTIYQQVNHLMITCRALALLKPALSNT